MTKSQKLIRRYLLKHYQEVAMMSAVEFGEKVNVSDATISRFVRTIGFENFYEFKNQLRESIKNFDSPYKRVVKLSSAMMNAPESADLQECLLQIGKRDVKNIEELMAHMDRELLERVVNVIFSVKTIYFIGVGSSAALVDFFCQHFRRMGFHIVPISEGGSCNLEKIISMTAEDLLFAITFPRYSRVTYDAILYAKKKGGQVVTMTDGSFSAIRAYSDFVIALEVENGTFFNSLVAPMLWSNWLVMMLFKKDQRRMQENMRENTMNTVLLNTKI